MGWPQGHTRPANAIADTNLRQRCNKAYAARVVTSGANNAKTTSGMKKHNNRLAASPMTAHRTTSSKSGEGHQHRRDATIQTPRANELTARPRHSKSKSASQQ